MRKSLALSVIIICFALALLLIWKESLQYLIPRSAAPINEKEISLSFTPNEEVNYLHFFNENCLNSRINIQHLRRVTDKYQHQANFFIINSGDLPEDEIRRQFQIPSYFQIISDPDGSIAEMTGIITTPYALLISPDKKLFHGNYNNSSGLCGPSDITYSGPAVALSFLVKNNRLPLIPEFQKIQMGCTIADI